MLAICYPKSGVTRKEVEEFELTEDFEHLPDSKELKMFLRCSGEVSEIVDPKSNKVLLSKIGEFFADLPREKQEIYVNMGKGCIRKAKLEKDLLEFTYVTSVCAKMNDNKVPNNAKYISRTKF